MTNWTTPRFGRLRRPDVEVVDFGSVEYLLADPEEDAFFVVLDPLGRPPRLPVRGPDVLRLRFHAPEGEGDALSGPFEPFGETHAEHALRFLGRSRPLCHRFIVCSPEAEVRGPGLALGVADLLRLAPERIAALEMRYRHHSRAVRKLVWRAAYPPPPVAARPEVKAASGILAFLSRYLSS